MGNLDDIERIAPGTTQLSQQELDALQGFTLFWTLFEAQVLECNASVRMIAKKVGDFDYGIGDGSWFQDQLKYFTDRYVENGQTNYRFDNLHLRPNDNPELVRAVLLGRNLDIHDELTACLTIVYRFRNNFFHGIKWAYGFGDQLDNFTHSIAILKQCLEKFERSI